MKVYVITKGEYSDYHICCVCLDRETAEKKAKMFENRYDGEYDKPEIEEYDTDDAEQLEVVDGETVRKDGKMLWAIDVYKDAYGRPDHGEIERLEINEYSMIEAFEEYKSYYWGRIYARTREEATKIMLDKIAKYRWEKVERGEDNG